MKVLIAGFSPQSTAAVELIVGSLWSDVTFVKLPRGTLLSAPGQSAEALACSLCVVDLLGLGMALWSAAREAELEAFLSGRRAILFVPAGGNDDWLSALWPGRLGPSRAILQHPASTASLRAALETLREHGQAESIGEVDKRQEAAGENDQPGLPAVALPPDHGDAIAPGETVAEPTGEPPLAPSGTENVQDEAAAFTERLLQDELNAEPPPPGANPLPTGGESEGESTDRRPARAANTVGDDDWAEELDEYDAESMREADTRPLRHRWQDGDLTKPNDAHDRPGTAKATVSSPGAFEFMARTPDESDGRYSAPVVPPHPLVRADRRTNAFSITGYSLDESAYSGLLAACPDVARNPYLNLICNIVMRRSPSELRITTRTGAVFFPAENWVASNISTAFRKRLTQHEMMLQIVQVHQLQEEHAHDRAARLFGRRGDGPRSLDAFMWSLVFTTFEQSPPVSVGDLHFQVHRFPNFARLHKMPDLFSQLSQVCMRQPQSLSGLKRAFSKYDPNLVTLFVACTILSGVATVLQTGSSAGTEGATRSKRDTAHKAARRTGLFRSLLDKLF